MAFDRKDARMFQYRKVLANLEILIDMTPTSERRNQLTDINIHLVKLENDEYKGIESIALRTDNLHQFDD